MAKYEDVLSYLHDSIDAREAIHSDDKKLNLSDFAPQRSYGEPDFKWDI